jgi:beta-mannosidase
MATSKETLSLNEGWKYTTSDGSDAADLENWHNAQPVPTSIHLDLFANGSIPDPFPAKNEQLVQWVGKRTWIYEKQFTVPSQLLSNLTRMVVLVFEGLDTYTTIMLNGRIILETDNMFLSHRVDITEQIRSTQTTESKTHTLRIIFHNAEQKAVEEIEKHPEESWFSFHFGNKRLAARKAQYHFVCYQGTSPPSFPFGEKS